MGYFIYSYFATEVIWNKFPAITSTDNTLSVLMSN